MFAEDGSKLLEADTNVPPPSGLVLGRLCAGQLTDPNGRDCAGWYAVKYAIDGFL